MNGYHVLVVENGNDPQETMRRLLIQREWVESVMKSVSGTMDSLDPPAHCLLLEVKLPDGERTGRVRLVGDLDEADRHLRASAVPSTVRLALVKGMDPSALFQDSVDFEEACRACEAETLLMTEEPPVPDRTHSEKSR